MTVIDEIRARAADRPRHPAIAAAAGSGDGVAITTYRDLVEMMESRSAALRRAGSGNGERVGLLAPQGAQFIASALAILDAGCCLVPIPGDQTETALREFVRSAELHAVLRASTTADISRVDGAIPPADEFVALQPAYLRFTSGTTAERKGVVVSHPRILERLTAANRGMQIGPEDRVMWLLPMAHHFVVSILLYLSRGASILLPANSLAQSILDLAQRTEPSVFYASPYHYGLLAVDASQRRLDAVRLAVSTAEGLREATARRFRERFDIDLVQALGIIEVGLPLMNLAAAAAKPTAIGRPLPHYNVWLRGEDGRPVSATGSPQDCGEVCIRGPGMFDAYLQPWTPSSRVLEPDGFRTGDQGWFDCDGDLHLVGRRANRINMAGMKFFSEEVEAVLDRHPAILRSRVAAREHAHLGQIPVAEVVLRPGCTPPAAMEMADHCRAHLPAYKVPRQFAVVAELPMTATGKIRRH